MKTHLNLLRPSHFLLPAIFFITLTTLYFYNSTAIAKEKKPQAKQEKIQTGKASYYCRRFHGNKTALGKTFDRHQLVAAHPSYPFGTLVRVTNLNNDQEVQVRIIDRGPTKAQCKKGVIIDLSRAAAEKIGMVRKGRVLVRVEVLKWGKSKDAKKDKEDDQSPTES